MGELVSIGHATVLGEVHFFGNPVKPKTDAPVPAAAPVVADEGLLLQLNDKRVYLGTD